MDASIARVAALAADQQGLVTRAQLVDLGRTKHQIDHAVATQRLSLVLPGVYRISGSPTTSDCALAAALLVTEAVASHRSAAHLLHLIEKSPSSPELTVAPRQCQQKPGLILHRSRDLAPADVIRIRGLRCTTATRTLVDLGAVVNPDVLDLRTPTLAAAESELELLLWQILRRHRLPLPERQVKFTVGGRNYRLDLAYCAERIFIEGDGFGVHSPRAAFESDRTRQNKLVGAGWAPLLFTWQRARRAEADVAADVRTALASRRRGFGSA